MPRLRHVELKFRSVEATLIASKRGLLPGKMTEQPLVEWILGFEGDRSELPAEPRPRYGRDGLTSDLGKSCPSDY